MNEEEDRTGVIFFRKKNNTKTRKILDPNTYNQLMEEKYATKINQAKSAIYGDCNEGVSVINKWEPGNFGYLDQPIVYIQHTLHTKTI